MVVNLPPCPASLKQIQHYLKIANEHDDREQVVSYWSRLFALQIGLKVNTQQADENALLLAIMDWLETAKKENKENEAITNEVVAQAHLENYALKLFTIADKQDRESNFDKNVVKCFYTSGMIYDILQTFGELSEEAIQNRKYAKWKAAYIHNCLKNGETPLPGPPAQEESENSDSLIPGLAEPETPTITSNETDPDSNISLPSGSNIGVEDILANPKILPSPPVEDKAPGGFVPYIPTESQVDEPEPAAAVLNPANVSQEQIHKAKKYCKHAASALDFDDIKSAIELLQKAMSLLKTGEE